MKLSDQITYSTVPITCKTSDGIITGTGFLVGFEMISSSGVSTNEKVIFTNRHVMVNATETTVTFCSVVSGAPNDHVPVRIVINDPQNITTYHPNGIDLCAIRITELLEETQKAGKPVYALLYEYKDIAPISSLNLTAIEDVVMVGYPNGLVDTYNNKPIVRKGITATHPAKKYNGKDEFVIDMACFPGSSGSPVLLYSPLLKKETSENELSIFLDYRVTLLGVLYAGPKHVVEGPVAINSISSSPVPIAKIPTMINLGYVINVSQIGVVLSEIAKNLVAN